MLDTGHNSMKLGMGFAARKFLLCLVFLFLLHTWRQLKEWRVPAGIKFMESWNPELFGVGRDLKVHPVPTLCRGRGHLPPARAAQSLEHFD